MVNRVMAKWQMIVNLGLACVDGRTITHLRHGNLDCTLQVGNLDRLGNHPAATIPGTHDRGLSNGSTICLELLVPMLGGFYAADVSFIDLDNARSIIDVVTACLSDASQHMP